MSYGAIRAAAFSPLLFCCFDPALREDFFLFFEKQILAVLDGFQGGVMRNEKRWQILLKFDLKRGGVECGGHTEEEKAGEEDIINYFTHIQACRCMLVW